MSSAITAAHINSTDTVLPGNRYGAVRKAASREPYTVPAIRPAISGTACRCRRRISRPQYGTTNMMSAGPSSRTRKVRPSSSPAAPARTCELDLACCRQPDRHDPASSSPRSVRWLSIHSDSPPARRISASGSLQVLRLTYCMGMVTPIASAANGAQRGPTSLAARPPNVKTASAPSRGPQNTASPAPPAQKPNESSIGSPAMNWGTRWLPTW